jgi:hypothetical protein
MIAMRVISSVDRAPQYTVYDEVLQCMLCSRMLQTLQRPLTGAHALIQAKQVIKTVTTRQLLPNNRFPQHRVLRGRAQLSSWSLYCCPTFLMFPDLMRACAM